MERHNVKSDNARCFVIRNRNALKLDLVIVHPTTGERMTCHPEVEGGGGTPWGVGCSSCRAAGVRNRFGRMAVRCSAGVQIGRLQRHAESQTHQRALRAWEKKRSGGLFGDQTPDSRGPMQDPLEGISYAHVRSMPV